MWKCCKREWNQRSLKRSACTCMLASVKDCRCLHLLEQGRWAMAPWRKVRNYNYRNRTVFWNFLTSQTFWCSQFSSGLWQWLWLSFDMNPWLTGNPFFFDSRPWFLVIFPVKQSIERMNATVANWRLWGPGMPDQLGLEWNLRCQRDISVLNVWTNLMNFQCLDGDRRDRCLKDFFTWATWVLAGGLMHPMAKESTLARPCRRSSPAKLCQCDSQSPEE